MRDEAGRHRIWGPKRGDDIRGLHAARFSDLRRFRAFAPADSHRRSFVPSLSVPARRLAYGCSTAVPSDTLRSRPAHAGRRTPDRSVRRCRLRCTVEPAPHCAAVSVPAVSVLCQSPCRQRTRQANIAPHIALRRDAALLYPTFTSGYKAATFAQSAPLRTAFEPLRQRRPETTVAMQIPADIPVESPGRRPAADPGDPAGADRGGTRAGRPIAGATPGRPPAAARRAASHAHRAGGARPSRRRAGRRRPQHVLRQAVSGRRLRPLAAPSSPMRRRTMGASDRTTGSVVRFPTIAGPPSM